MEKPKLLIIGGDTGGHLYPGIAVAREIKSLWDVFFIIGERPVVRDILVKEGFQFDVLEGRAFPRKNILGYAAFMAVTVKSIAKAWKMLSNIKPAVVLSTGGYMSFAPVLAARLRGIPVIIHEQNVKPGLANRIVSLMANRVGVSFFGSEKFFPARKVFVCGNPVRKEFYELQKKTRPPRSDTHIVVFGGSQGSAYLNDLMPGVLLSLSASGRNIRVTHITGIKDAARIKSFYEEHKIAADARAYHDNVPELFFDADLVVSRSGASTIAELIALKKPALLVPFLQAAGNHQYFNALNLAEKHCAVLETQQSLTAEKLNKLLLDLAGNAGLLKEMSDHYDEIPERALATVSILTEEIEKLK
jgi:UDP-N-acetylglucosamine--N-acetylmuramyl-(pentapeptide) pyrophosphoryl-undecaprenol N-acetylglucosamine transferase